MNEPKSPSPKFFKSLIKSGLANITFIGTSGVGKSKATEKFLNLNNGRKLWGAYHVDLKIAEALHQRISKDMDTKSKVPQNAKEISNVGNWMGTVLHDRERYIYASFWYLHEEKRKTSGALNAFETGINTIIDTTGSVFTVDKEFKELLNKNSLIVYIDGSARAKELGERVATDKKPISLSNLDDFDKFMNSLLPKGKYLEEILEYGAKIEILKDLIKYKDYKHLKRKKEYPFEDVENTIYSILGVYYANKEMQNRDKLYRRMNPDIIVPGRKLYEMRDANEILNFFTKELEKTWRGKTRMASECEKLPDAPQGSYHVPHY